MDNIELWKKAGKIAGEARDFGKTLVKEGNNYLEISRKIEEFILKKKAGIGFPVQLSTNNIAAHYTAFPDDKTTFKKGDLVKLDLGAHIDGFIGDTAITIEVGSNNNEDLIKASENALNAAIKLSKPGTKLCEIGTAIESEITSLGFKSIKNLSGHKVDQYILHSNLTIPNYNNNDKTELEENTVIAIEPFASTGAGSVKEGKPSSNYRLFNPKNVRDQYTKEIMIYITENFKTLPFAKRHLIPIFSPARVSMALFTLLKNGIIYEYPQLPEKESDSLVSQKEHTVLVKDKPLVLTKTED